MNRILKLPILALTTALFVASCGDDDNPVDSHDEEHAEAFGVVVLNSGEEIARDEAGNVTGEIDVGVERETALLTLRFIAVDDRYPLARLGGLDRTGMPCRSGADDGQIHLELVSHISCGSSIGWLHWPRHGADWPQLRPPARYQGAARRPRPCAAADAGA